ncbi:MAG: WecB/TagA/CpsF family glycosyltransferase [Caldilineaceae bacterium]|nr:WecB/TagA/CpsF family glycosyltransferase [Caldilineaceae bacterium]
MTNILGVDVSAINMQQAVQAIEGWIERRERHYVCVTNVHSIMECQHDKALRQVFNQAGLVTPDGVPLVWLNRLAGHRHVERVYGPDLMLAMCERSVPRGYRHYFFGGQTGVPDLLVQKLLHRFPKLQVAGSYSPPFGAWTTQEIQSVTERINQARPDIVWVGLGAPKQERWMAENVGLLETPALIGVGAAFDFHAGLKPQAPHWMQRNGLEWLFRFGTEPRRLWRRYLIYNPLFIGHVLLQLSGLRRYPLS